MISGQNLFYNCKVIYVFNINIGILNSKSMLYAWLRPKNLKSVCLNNDGLFYLLNSYNLNHKLM